jgi:hypothetical protein
MVVFVGNSLLLEGRREVDCYFRLVSGPSLHSRGFQQINIRFGRSREEKDL